MKTEREIYLKPLTLREQVAMEQGICSASILVNKKNTVQVEAHTVGGDYDFGGNESVDDSFGVSWD